MKAKHDADELPQTERLHNSETRRDSSAVQRRLRSYGDIG